MFNMDDLANIASKRTGKSQDEVKKALNSSAASDMLKKLSPDQAKKLAETLNDKAKTEQMLNSPAAQMIMKKFFNK